MKLEHSEESGRHVVVFKAWPRYFEAVKVAGKTAEARLLAGDELRALEDAALAGGGVSHVCLVNDETGERLERRLSWFGEVGQVLGSSLYLFCWKEEP